jgi:hypothetical protein
MRIEDRGLRIEDRKGRRSTSGLAEVLCAFDDPVEHRTDVLPFIVEFAMSAARKFVDIEFSKARD